MSKELIELAKTARDSQKLLKDKLNELLVDAEKEVSVWKEQLSESKFEKAIRITFVLQKTRALGTDYWGWNGEDTIVEDYLGWKKQFVRKKEKFLYSEDAGFIKLGKLFKSPFERSSRIINIVELNELGQLEYTYEASSYNGFECLISSFHQKFKMDISNHHIIDYSCSDHRLYDCQWHVSDLGIYLEKRNKSLVC